MADDSQIADQIRENYSTTVDPSKKSFTQVEKALASRFGVNEGRIYNAIRSGALRVDEQSGQIQSIQFQGQNLSDVERLQQQAERFSAAEQGRFVGRPVQVSQPTESEIDAGMSYASPLQRNSPSLQAQRQQSIGVQTLYTPKEAGVTMSYSPIYGTGVNQNIPATEQTTLTSQAPSILESRRSQVSAEFTGREIPINPKTNRPYNIVGRAPTLRERYTETIRDRNPVTSTISFGLGFAREKLSKFEGRSAPSLFGFETGERAQSLAETSLFFIPVVGPALIFASGVGQFTPGGQREVKQISKNLQESYGVPTGVSTTGLNVLSGLAIVGGGDSVIRYLRKPITTSVPRVAPTTTLKSTILQDRDKFVGDTLIKIKVPAQRELRTNRLGKLLGKEPEVVIIGKPQKFVTTQKFLGNDDGFSRGVDLTRRRGPSTTLTKFTESQGFSREVTPAEFSKLSNQEKYIIKTMNSKGPIRSTDESTKFFLTEGKVQPGIPTPKPGIRLDRVVQGKKKLRTNPLTDSDISKQMGFVEVRPFIDSESKQVFLVRAGQKSITSRFVRSSGKVDEATGIVVVKQTKFNPDATDVNFIAPVDKVALQLQKAEAQRIAAQVSQQASQTAKSFIPKISRSSPIKSPVILEDSFTTAPTIVGGLGRSVSEFANRGGVQSNDIISSNIVSPTSASRISITGMSISTPSSNKPASGDLAGFSFTSKDPASRFRNVIQSKSTFQQSTAPASILAQAPQQKQFPEQAQPQVQIPFQGQSSNQFQAPSQSQTPRLDQPQLQVPQQTQSPRITQVPRTPEIQTPKQPRPTRPRVPRVPIIAIPKGTPSNIKYILEKVGNSEGFDVFIGTGKKERKIAENVPFNLAGKIGTERVLGTIAASFTRRASGKTTTIKDVQFNIPTQLFRPGKKDATRIVQRKGGREGGLGRLASRGERLEIKAAKRSKPKKSKDNNWSAKGMRGFLLR